MSSVFWRRMRLCEESRDGPHVTPVALVGIQAKRLVGNPAYQAIHPAVPFLAQILFKRYTGMTVLDAIRKTRLEKTFALLKNPRIPLDAIPFQCGYATAPAYLKTYFKRVTGLTMREWRKKNTQ